MKLREPYTMNDFEEGLYPALILFAALLMLGALLTGCGASSDGLEFADDSQPVVVPDALTFWWHAGNPALLVPGLECAVRRIREATCLPLDVSLDANHWLRHKTEAEMGGRAGWTTGPWATASIAVKDTLQDYHQCPIITHEIVHVLRRSNGHPCPGRSMSSPDGVWSREPGGSRITACDLEQICAVQNCGCMVSEPP